MHGPRRHPPSSSSSLRPRLNYSFRTRVAPRVEKHGSRAEISETRGNLCAMACIRQIWKRVVVTISSLFFFSSSFRWIIRWIIVYWIKWVNWTLLFSVDARFEYLKYNCFFLFFFFSSKEYSTKFLPSSLLYLSIGYVIIYLATNR